MFLKLQRREKTDMLKKISSIILAASLLAAPAALTACGEADYSDYRISENMIGSEKYDEKELAAYLFKPEDADARLEIVDTESETVVQSYEFPETDTYYALFELEYALPGADFQDMNFDGYKDLYIPCCASTANLEGMAWLWDKDSAAFVLCEELCELYELVIDPEEEMIMGTDYTAADGPLRTEYTWEDGKLIKTDEYTINN